MRKKEQLIQDLLHLKHEDFKNSTLLHDLILATSGEYHPTVEPVYHQMTLRALKALFVAVCQHRYSMSKTTCIKAINEVFPNSTTRKRFNVRLASELAPFVLLIESKPKEVLIPSTELRPSKDIHCECNQIQSRIADIQSKINQIITSEECTSN